MPLSLLLRLFLLLWASSSSTGLTPDGILLLSFKYSILSDPLSSLSDWNYDDPSPCSWHGVTCSSSNVTSLSLPNAHLVGPISSDLFFLPSLAYLDLSSNSLNGSLPSTLSNLTSLLYLSLSNNDLSGSLPDDLEMLTSLRHLNLSDNALTGALPPSLALLPNLTDLSLSNNYLTGEIQGGFFNSQVLDFSLNLFNGTLPAAGVGGAGTRYLNLSYNRISGEIPANFAARLPTNVTVDLSFNKLRGEVPASAALVVQRPGVFAGNLGLCGKPLRALCSVPSSLSKSSPAPGRSPKSPPALAVLPRTVGEVNSSYDGGKGGAGGGLQPAAVAGIVVGDIVGVALVSFLVLYLYNCRKKKWSTEKSRKQKASSSSSSSSESGDSYGEGRMQGEEGERGGALVTVDGETELEIETLLKASAYILGATGASIVYKAVLADGTALAVRRLGDGGRKLKEFEGQVRSIAKLRHPNLVRICGFYWGTEEKLLITEYVPNGSLAHLNYKKTGSSPYHLPWYACLLIARGIARVLTYLHDKKTVHGHVKPSNILLHHDFQPKLSDLGLDRLTSNFPKQASSLRHIGSSSKRSSLSHSSSQQEPSPSPYNPSPYHAPESFSNLKPSTKWDVYSFGIVLLEMLTGRVFEEVEVAEWSSGSWGEDADRRAVRTMEVGLRREMEGREGVLVGWFKLGLSCAAAQPGRRPAMREVLLVLERMPQVGSLT